MQVSSVGLAVPGSFALDLHDLDELNHAVSGSNLELIQLKPGRLDAMLRQVTLSDFSVDQSFVNRPVRVYGQLDPQRFSIGLIPHQSEATWNGIPADGSRLLLFKRGAELKGHFAENYSSTSLVVPAAWMESIGQTLQCSGAFKFGAEVASLRPDPCRLDDLWRAAQAIVAAPSPAPFGIDRERWMLMDIRNCLGAALISLDASSCKGIHQARAHFSLARRAEDYMRERISEPLSIDKLCTELHVSRRYLEYAFSDAVGASPSRYLRLLRLNEVHHRLQCPGDSTTVTFEATELGFVHLSQFAVQYKQQFGQCPSATLADARRKSNSLQPRALPVRISDSAWQG